MIRGVLFDMGGTLDGDGQHWLDRFAAVYAGCGIARARDDIRAAFDAAERRAATDEIMLTADLDTMIDRHLTWQHEQLGLADAGLRRRMVAAFIDPMRRAARVNRPVLAALRARGLALGVVSNGCGNADVLVRDLGYDGDITAVVDSRRAGVSKPDSAIFIHAASSLGLPPSAIVMVGDSFDRDIRPAKTIGMTTAWLEGATPRECPEPRLVDIRLRQLADLPAALDQPATTTA